MPSNQWHPPLAPGKLDYSIVHRMNGSPRALILCGKSELFGSSIGLFPEVRFAIGTVQAALWRKQKNSRSYLNAKRWELWAEGKDWKS